MGVAKQVRSDSELVDQLLAAAPNAMVILDADSRIVRVNTQAEKLLGYSREELLGQKPDLLMPRRHRGRNVKRRPGHVAPPRIRPFGDGLEVLIRRRDGTEFPGEISLGFLETGAETLISSAIRDIQQKRVEELDLTAIVEASDDAIIGRSLDGTIVSWNKGAEKIFGYQKKEVLGHPMSVLIPPGQPNELPAIMKQLQRGQSFESYETTRIHKDGHRIDVSLTISPVKDKTGKVVGASGVARDITRQKQAEAALRLSEERLRVALANAPVVVFTQDLQLRYTWITPPVLAWDYRNLLGSTAAESFGAWDLRSFVGCTDAEIFGEEQGAHLTAIKQEVLRTGVGSRTEVAVTFEGVTRHFDLVVEPFRDAQGTLLGLTSSAIDTTPWKYLIAKLKEALDQVQLLSGLLPICASCKRIKDKREVWQPLEVYIQAHSEAKFTHGVCPDCLRKLYPEYCPQ
jgi:PAS domain S-box-containing protein